MFWNPGCWTRRHFGLNHRGCQTIFWGSHWEAQWQGGKISGTWYMIYVVTLVIVEFSEKQTLFWKFLDIYIVSPLHKNDQQNDNSRYSTLAYKKYGEIVFPRTEYIRTTPLLSLQCGYLLLLGLTIHNTRYTSPIHSTNVSCFSGSLIHSYHRPLCFWGPGSYHIGKKEVGQKWLNFWPLTKILTN